MGQLLALRTPGLSVECIGPPWNVTQITPRPSLYFLMMPLSISMTCCRRCALRVVQNIVSFETELSWYGYDTPSILQYSIQCDVSCHHWQIPTNATVPQHTMGRSISTTSSAIVKGLCDEFCQLKSGKVINNCKILQACNRCMTLKGTQKTKLPLFDWPYITSY